MEVWTEAEPAFWSPGWYETTQCRGAAVLIRGKVHWRAGMSGSRVRVDSSKKYKKWSSKT